MSMLDLDQSATKRYLRACLVCAIIQTEGKFLANGCPNCEDHLELRNDHENVERYTSKTYEGTIVLMDPTTSWVARWKRLDKYVPGMYANKVEGILDEEDKDYTAVIRSLTAAGITYIPRDGSREPDMEALRRDRPQEQSEAE